MRLIPDIAVVLMACMWQGSAWAQGKTSSGSRAEARAELQDAKDQERSVLARIEEIDKDIIGKTEELNALRDEISALESLLGTHQLDAQTAEEVLSSEREKIAERVGALYRLKRRGTNRVVFGSEDPTELRRRNSYLVYLIEAEMNRMRAFISTVETTNQALALVESDQAELQGTQAALETALSSLEAQRDRKKDLLGDIRTRSELALQSLSEMDSSRQSLQELSGGEALSNRETATETVTEDSGSAPKGFRGTYGRLRWPVAGRVVHRYGTYTDGNGQSVESKGIDIEADYGSPVRAVHDGEVRLADYVRGYGQTVALRHGSYTTIYAHLNGIRVRKGQKVQEGDVVGLVGNTGLTEGDGYMLTFEIHYNSTPQNPGPWLSPE